MFKQEAEMVTTRVKLLELDAAQKAKVAAVISRPGVSQRNIAELVSAALGFRVGPAQVEHEIRSASSSGDLNRSLYIERHGKRS